MVPLENYLVLSAIIFSLGVYGVARAPIGQSRESQRARRPVLNQRVSCLPDDAPTPALPEIPRDAARSFRRTHQYHPPINPMKSHTPG